MAGSGSGLTTWASSAAYHQDKGDYNDNVIVPRSILVDTADAIRIKKSGTAEVKSDVDAFGETYLASSAMTPGNFATEIGNLTTGSSGGISFDALGAAMTNAGSMPTPSSGYFYWNGDIRKYLCIIQLGTGAYSGGSFNRGYMYFLNDLYNTSNYITRNSQQYVPVKQLASSTANGNTYFGVYTGYMVSLSSLTNSYDKADNQTFTAQILDTSGRSVSQQYSLYQWGIKIPDIII